MKEEFELFRSKALSWIGGTRYNIVEDGVNYEGDYVLKVNFISNKFKWVKMKCGGYKTATLILALGKPKREYYSQMGSLLYSLGNKWQSKMDFTYSGDDVVLVFVDVNYSDPYRFFQSNVNGGMSAAKADIDKLLTMCE